MSEIARTIYAQLGGRRFESMTGAKAFVSGGFDLTFRFPKAKAGINGIRIELTPDDLYRVSFFRMRGEKCTCVVVFDGVFCDGLESLFETVTGLKTRMF